MVRIPPGAFTLRFHPQLPLAERSDPVSGCPGAATYPMVAFYMDTYPVTNEQFQEFLTATRYAPADRTNFLKHWVNGAAGAGHGEASRSCMSTGMMPRPMRDGRASDFPTEVEWQYAAQGTDGRKYPWGQEFDSTRCNYGTQATTPVDAFPSGASPFGVMDMVGNVWQLTADLYTNGTFYYGMLRGGSYYNPTSSWWYVRGGPQPVDNPQILLLVAPGFDRCATVGFRCVKDAAHN